MDIPRYGKWYGTFFENKLHGIATKNGKETFEFLMGKKHGKVCIYDGEESFKGLFNQGIVVKIVGFTEGLTVDDNLMYE